ncbi:glucuronate isomerase [Anaerosporomusa subterranea]|uniref:Uronate isomerase n=1 Tax=Anaerosporomusa subterranea TaxID=1794912 RepID=A0A154BVM6_ANASB|nr:glucuronate isomerase [Anaerosporomusa subterranea]KYZ78084.1 glucuronate isomerase [Anaerosporomusa subterranea]
MKQFMDENFLLSNKTAEILYHDYAKEMPIFDFHCHLSPKEVAENKRYRNIAEIWLGGDHYKWRAMRANGVDERFITGDAPDKDKFMKWAETMTQCIGNPLYHWTHLELKRFFGIDKLLSPQTADEIWEKCNELLQKDEFTAQGLIKRSNVKAICTTDDPADSLEYHIALAKNTAFGVKVLPAFRPDKSFNIDKDGFLDWIAKLANVTGKEIKTVAAVKEALLQRLEFFHQVGCRVSDHALDPIVFATATEEQANAVLQKALQGKELSELEVKQYKTHIMVFLGKQYARLGWVMQLHIGTIRNNNSRMMRLIGPDTGFDATADYTIAEPLAKFFDALDTTDELPKTILYCLNPRDNDVLSTIAGCFQGGVPGKMQFGSGWWFNDQKDGMLKQMTTLANIGLLSRFVGMLTDSRSFLSYTRHEYFRRILCNMIGEWVENGEAPNDIELLGAMVKNICFTNAEQYFGIEL